MKHTILWVILGTTLVVPTTRTLFAESVKLDPMLIEEVSKETNFQSVVDEFMKRALANPAITFEQPSGQPLEVTSEALARAKQWLAQVLAKATRGDVDVAALQHAAAEVGLTTAELDALQADLAASLTDAAIPVTDQQVLLATLEAAQTDLLALQ